MTPPEPASLAWRTARWRCGQVAPSSVWQEPSPTFITDTHTHNIKNHHRPSSQTHTHNIKNLHRHTHTTSRTFTDFRHRHTQNQEPSQKHTHNIKNLHRPSSQTHNIKNLHRLSSQAHTHNITDNGAECEQPTNSSSKLWHCVINPLNLRNRPGKGRPIQTPP